MVFATPFTRTGRRANVSLADLRLQQMLNHTATIRQDKAQAVTVEQDGTATTLRFDVPGVSREQLHIGIEGNVVRIETIAGAPRQYAMAYRLAQDIAAETSSAKLENGVLTVKLAKPVPVDRSTRIAVH